MMLRLPEPRSETGEQVPDLGRVRAGRQGSERGGEEPSRYRQNQKGGLAKGGLVISLNFQG